MATNKRKRKKEKRAERKRKLRDKTAIRKLIEEMGGNKQFVIPTRRLWKRAEKQQCFPNVERYVEEHGGKLVTGWCISRPNDGLYIAIPHGIWLSPESEFVDISPGFYGIGFVVDDKIKDDAKFHPYIYWDENRSKITRMFVDRETGNSFLLTQRFCDRLKHVYGATEAESLFAYLADLEKTAGDPEAVEAKDATGIPMKAKFLPDHEMITV